MGQVTAVIRDVEGDRVFERKQGERAKNTVRAVIALGRRLVNILGRNSSQYGLRAAGNGRHEGPVAVRENLARAWSEVKPLTS